MRRFVLSAELSVVVCSLGRIGRSDRVERVAAAEIHVLEAVLDLVGHLRHVSVERLRSALREDIMLYNQAVCKAVSLAMGGGYVYLCGSGASNSGGGG